MSLPLVAAAREAMSSTKGKRAAAITALADRIRTDPLLAAHIAERCVDVMIEAEIEKHGPDMGQA